MSTFLQQITNILVTAPGNLIYHIVLAFCLAASLQAALLTSRRSDEPHAGRLVLGLSMVLVAQFILFAASGLAWQQVADLHRYAPPLDRAVTAFSVLWIVWLWAFPKPARLADALVGVLSLGAIVGVFFTLDIWLQQPADLSFNGTALDWYWELSTLILTGLGVLALLVVRPAYWGIGLASLGLLMAGYISNLLMFTPGGDYAGVVRLGQLTAYLMLPVLAQRLLPEQISTLEALPVVEDTPVPRNLPDMRQAQSWTAVVLENDPDKRTVALARAVAQSMHADLCFFLTPPGENSDPGLWQIPGGYDLVTQEPLSAAAVETERIPALANALQRGKPIRMMPGDTSKNELVEVGKLFGLDDAGSLLAAPLIAAGKVWGGIVLLSPYGNRVWEDDTQGFLSNLSESLIQIVQKSPVEAAPAAPARLQAELDAVRAENQTLAGQINTLRQQKPAVDVESLLVVQQEAQAVIASLQEENEQLKARMNAPAAPADDQQMEGELRLLLQEVALLKNQLAEANMDLEKARHLKTVPVSNPNSQDVLTSIAQDLRQPVTIILGYVEMLLADTAGALTVEQRTLLLRVISSTERLRAMINDLVSAAMHVRGTQVLETDPVDLEAVVNEAVASNNGLLREKNITLRVALPDELPVITGDRQAMEQILVDLLRNAGAVSPEGGEVLLRVDVEQEGEHPCVLFQVTDSGGGIPEEDVQRVFEPQYKAGQALIEGSADSGNSLPVVEALVKAQGGEVWVETEPGKSARFSVRLPIDAPIQPDDQAGV